jgi:predicted DCC family thiol-disulfide oxidoreductase YuxK
MAKLNIEELRQFKKIIFFDGTCNLCNTIVTFIIRRDRHSNFMFCQLQSEHATSFLKDCDLPQTDSVVLIDQKSITTKSPAVLKIARELDGIWPLLYMFRIVPISFRDFLYQYIARNRYRWFGKKKNCRVPSKKEKALFIS